MTAVICRCKTAFEGSHRHAPNTYLPFAKRGHVPVTLVKDTIKDLGNDVELPCYACMYVDDFLLGSKINNPCRRG